MTDEATTTANGKSPTKGRKAFAGIQPKSIYLQLQRLFRKRRSFTRLTSVANTVALIFHPHGLLRKSQEKTIHKQKWHDWISKVQTFPHLQEDWDDMGAKLADAEVLQTTIELMKEMRRVRIVPPNLVAPGNRGEIALEWRKGLTCYTMEVPNPNQVDLSILIDGQGDHIVFNL